MSSALSETIRTIRVGITGTSATESYTLAPGLAQYVEAVYIEVDNTSGQDTSPLLTISEQAGVVIAKKRQGDVIDAAATGSATWALRLSDESASGAVAHPVGFYTAAPNGGNPVPSGTHTASMALTFAGAGGGVDLLDTSVLGSPVQWAVKTPGVYGFLARIAVDPHPAAAWPAGNSVQFDLTPFNDPAPANFWATQTTTRFPLHNTFGDSNNTVYVARFLPVYRSAGVPYLWHIDLTWTYVGDVDVSGFVEVIRLG